MPPAEVAARLRERGGELIDVRTPGEYAQIHAEGATLVPLHRLDPREVIASRNGAADEPIYLICRSGGRSATACAKFRAAGFNNVVNVVGGTTAWERAGLPIVRGASRVIPLERQVRIAAGLVVMLGLLLGWLVHPAGFALSGFIAAGLIFSGVTGWCGMAMLLAKMPWNNRHAAGCAAGCDSPA